MDFEAGIEAFRDFYLREGYSPITVRHMDTCLRQLVRFLESRGARSWKDLTPEHAAAYQAHCLDRTPSSQAIHATTVGRMGDFLVREGILFSHPKEGLRHIRRRIVREQCLSPAEVEAILAACDLDTRIGIRDHALFALLWEGAVNFHDACRISLDDLGSDCSTVVLSGRLIELAEPARVSLVTYLEARDHLARFRAEEKVLFLSRQGRPLNSRKLWSTIVGPYAKKAGIVKGVPAHAFRWARVKALLDEGLPDEQVRLLAGYQKGAFNGLKARLSK